MGIKSLSLQGHAAEPRPFSLGPVFRLVRFAFVIFVCVCAHMYFCTDVDLCKNFANLLSVQNLVRDYDNACKGWHRTDRKQKQCLNTFS